MSNCDTHSILHKEGCKFVSKYESKYLITMKNLIFSHSLLNVLAQTANKMGLKKTPWSESASKLYRPSDRRLSVR
jgi:hypothetical protein